LFRVLGELEVQLEVRLILKELRENRHVLEASG